MVSPSPKLSKPKKKKKEKNIPCDGRHVSCSCQPPRLSIFFTFDKKQRLKNYDINGFFFPDQNPREWSRAAVAKAETVIPLQGSRSVPVPDETRDETKTDITHCTFPNMCACADPIFRCRRYFFLFFPGSRHSMLDPPPLATTLRGIASFFPVLFFSVGNPLEQD